MTKESLDYWKNAIEIAYYIVAIFAALLALWIYRRNSRLERSQWASSLYEKFYERENLKDMRNMLDCPADSEQINEIVIREDAKFTDYLNFFEYVAFLKDSRQLRDSEVEALFGYYLDCLNRHERIRKYINDTANGYEKLRALLKKRK